LTGIYVLLSTNQVLRLKQNRSFLIFWVERLMNYHAFDNDDCFQRGVAFFTKLQAGGAYSTGSFMVWLETGYE